MCIRDRAVAERADFLDAGGCELTKADHVHLTAKGHRQLAERMETAVRDILGKTVPEDVYKRQEFRYVSGSRSGAYVGSGTYGYGGKGEAYRGGTSFESTFSDTTGSGNKNSWFYLHVYSKTTAGKTITLNVGTSIFD